MATERLTSGAVKAALMKRFCAPEWALMFEVGDATGALQTRFADAVAMSLWPSRGLELHGIEIKVSRADWQNERKNPAKAETIARFCERWYLVTGPRVVLDIAEIPPAWGWLELVDGRFYERQKAERTAAEPMTRAFLAALLRRAAGADAEVVDALVAKRCANAEARINDRVAEAVRYKTRELETLKSAVAEFESASGFKIDAREWGGSNKALGRAVAMVQASGVADPYGGLSNVADTLRRSAEKIERALAEAGAPVSEAAQ